MVSYQITINRLIVRLDAQERMIEQLKRAVKEQGQVW